MSKLSIGIVGLPNVGKSTLFNALLGRAVADASNYPFCTIDPNVGVVEVPDDKLGTLADIAQSQKIIPAAVEFVDIAGLVKGASEGQGLGNKFLTNIRDCDAICHVVRYFSDPNVVKEGSVDPKGDLEVIFAELIIKDLESIDRYLDANKNNAVEKNSKKYSLAGRIKQELEKGILAVNIDLDHEQNLLLKDFFLLTAKPYFVIANVNEADYPTFSDSNVIPVSAKIEYELSELSPEDRRHYLFQLGLEKSGLERVITKAYQTLGLQSFYTAGPKETRAWTVPKGATAPQAAGVIHTDFQRGFIMAEVVSYSDFVTYRGWEGAKVAGRLHHQGKDYIISPDDIVEFRFNL